MPSSASSRGFLAVLLLAALLRFWNLGGYELWADEIHTQLLVEAGVQNLLDPLFMAPYTPLYFFASRMASLALGQDEFLVRLLPALFGLLLIPLLHELWVRWHGSRAALQGALLLAVSPLLIYFSREHRMYSLYVLMVAASVVATLRALESNRHRDIWLACGAGTAAFFAFPFALLYMPSLALFFSKSTPWRRWIPPIVAGAAAVSAWAVPVLLRAPSDTQPYYGMLDPRMAAVAYKAMVIGNFRTGDGGLAAATALALPVIAVLSALALLRLASSPRSGQSRNVLFWLLFLSLPYVVMLFLQARQGAIYNYKSFLPAALACIGLAVAGLERLSSRASWAATLVAAGAMLFVDAAQLDRSHLYNWNTPRTASYHETVALLEREHPDASALLATDVAPVLAAQFYGSPREVTAYVDTSAYLERYPSMNRRAVIDSLRRRGPAPWPPEHLPDTLIVHGTLPQTLVASGYRPLSTPAPLVTILSRAP